MVTKSRLQLTRLTLLPSRNRRSAKSKSRSSVSIPVIGGFGGGPWLDGRVRMAHAAIGYGAKHLDGDIETYANVAKTSFEALTSFSKDVRAGRQIKGAPKARK